MSEPTTDVPTHVCPECIAHTVLGPEETVTEFHVRSFNDALIDIQFDLLQRAVVELRGEPEPMHRWSHHDIPDRIRALRESHAELVKAAVAVDEWVGYTSRAEGMADERYAELMTIHVNETYWGLAMHRILRAAIEKAEAINAE